MNIFDVALLGIVLLIIVGGIIGIFSPAILMELLSKRKELKRTKDWIRVEADLLSLSCHETEVSYKGRTNVKMEYSMTLGYNLPDGSSCENRCSVIVNHRKSVLSKKNIIFFQEGEKVKLLVDPDNHSRVAFLKIYEKNRMDDEGRLRFQLLVNGILTLLLPTMSFYIYTQYIKESLIWFFIGMYILIIGELVIGGLGIYYLSSEIRQGH